MDAYEYFKKYHKELKDIPSHIMIGHTRNSSVNHFKTASNAHPIQANSVVLTHNGTLKNWEALRSLYEFSNLDVDMDSKLLAFALDKTKSFEVLEKYDGTANIVWCHKDYPNSVFVYKDPDKPLFYGRKNGQLFISSLQDSLITIDVEDKIWTFHDNMVARIDGELDKEGQIPIAANWEVNRANVYKAPQKKSTTGIWYDNKRFDDYAALNEHKARKFREANEPIIANWKAIEPTSTVGGNAHQWDLEISQFVRKDIYDEFHNGKKGTNIDTSHGNKNASYKDEKGVKQPFTGVLATAHGKNIRQKFYYVAGKLSTLIGWETSYQARIKEAEDQWYAETERLEEERKKTVKLRNADCPVPRKWGEAGWYYTNGHLSSGLYTGLCEGNDMEELRKDIQTLKDDIEDLEVTNSGSKDIALNTEVLKNKEDLLSYYEERLKKHDENPDIIGKYFYLGTIVSKEEYEVKEKSQRRVIPLPTEGGIMEEVIDDDPINEEPSLADEFEKERLEQIASIEQELLDRFASIGLELSELNTMYRTIETPIAREMKKVGGVIGEVIIEIIENNILQRNNAAGSKFTTPEVLLPVNIQ